MIFCDAHLHIAQVGRLADFTAYPPEGGTNRADCRWYACTCSHTPQEFLATEALLSAAGRQSSPGRILLAFGLHPQAPRLEHAAFLEQLAQEGRIQAVGEAGFDLFTPEYRALLPAQEEAWHLQLELSAQYGLPLVNHTRKGLFLLFRDSSLLRRLPAVIFHSFMGSPQDARSLLARGINAYFSFGKPLLNGKKSALACLQELPQDRLLLETDAPYQTLKGEKETAPEEIVRVYEAAAALRKIDREQLSEDTTKNFLRAYKIQPPL